MRSQVGQLGDPGQVEQDAGAVTVEVQLDHDVGAAHDRHGAGVLGARREGVGQGGGGQELHQASPSRWTVTSISP